MGKAERRGPQGRGFLPAVNDGVSVSEVR
jgi:hypothetical protein